MSDMMSAGAEGPVSDSTSDPKDVKKWFATQPNAERTEGVVKHGFGHVKVGDLVRMKGDHDGSERKPVLEVRPGVCDDAIVVVELPPEEQMTHRPMRRVDGGTAVLPAPHRLPHQDDVGLVICSSYTQPNGELAGVVHHGWDKVQIGDTVLVFGGHVPGERVVATVAEARRRRKTFVTFEPLENEVEEGVCCPCHDTCLPVDELNKTRWVRAKFLKDLRTKLRNAERERDEARKVANEYSSGLGEKKAIKRLTDQLKKDADHRDRLVDEWTAALARVRKERDEARNSSHGWKTDCYAVRKERDEARADANRQEARAKEAETRLVSACREADNNYDQLNAKLEQARRDHDWAATVRDKAQEQIKFKEERIEQVIQERDAARAAAKEHTTPEQELANSHVESLEKEIRQLHVEMPTKQQLERARQREYDLGNELLAVIKRLRRKRTEAEQEIQGLRDEIAWLRKGHGNRSVIWKKMTVSLPPCSKCGFTNHIETPLSGVEEDADPPVIDDAEQTA